MVNFLFERWGLFVCVLLNVSMLCMCCCSRVHMYVCLCMYWHASLHIYTYFRCLLVGRSGTKEESVKRRVSEGGGN